MVQRLLPLCAIPLCWAPAADAARPEPHAPTVRSWLLQYFPDDRRERPEGPLRYAAAYTDLDGDGVDEAIVHVAGGGMCGSGGCVTFVLAARRGLWRRVSGHTITRPPIRVLPTSHRGWRDLSVWVAGGGILEGYHAALPFDGRTYPLNPSVPPARRLPPGSAGKVVIGRGTPLQLLRP